MILNIAAYRFVAIDDPGAFADHVRSLATLHALRGTVLVAPEGINMVLAGDEAPLLAFMDALQTDARLASLPVKESWSAALPFPRLKVKVKREIIAFRRDKASPLSGRAPTVDPSTLARWIESGHDD
ncbi:MAG TPA: sulfurtransferase, partial [Luteimonas sp.]|nr:sulfurtransferase [Luteimonas sp.]